jgi:hypothetical protein
MREALAAALPEFSGCLTRKLLTYAIERGLEAYDARTVASIEKEVAAKDYGFQTLIYAIVHSAPFLQSKDEPSARTNALAPADPAQTKPPARAAAEVK